MSRGDLSRRVFVGLAGAAALGHWLDALPALAEQLPFRPEGLPPAPAGTPIAPQTDLEWTFWWLAETIVPGAATDPEKAPGANECAALNLMFDPLLPLAASAQIVAALIDSIAEELHGTSFRELATTEQRVAVALDAETKLPLLTLVYRLIRAAFYGAAYNEIGTRWMGFPGESLGYIDHPDFTLGRPVGRELTRDGNMP